MLKRFPAEQMTMWPVSTRVNTPKSDDEDLLRPVRLPDYAGSAEAEVARANDPGGPKACELRVTRGQALHRINQ